MTVLSDQENQGKNLFVSWSLQVRLCGKLICMCSESVLSRIIELGIFQISVKIYNKIKVLIMVEAIVGRAIIDKRLHEVFI